LGFLFRGSRRGGGLLRRLEDGLRALHPNQTLGTPGEL
jgi:hypothetical protein